MPARLLALLLLASACDACTSCGGPRPPDAYDVDRLRDPYTLREDPKPPDVVERAAALIDFAAADLGYGRGPGNALRRRRTEAWVLRDAPLVDLGGLKALEAAHVDLIDTFTESSHTPADLKLALRRSESRLQEAVAEGLDPDTHLRTVVAELTWCLHLVATLTPDAG